MAWKLLTDWVTIEQGHRYGMLAWGGEEQGNSEGMVPSREYKLKHSCKQRGRGGSPVRLVRCFQARSQGGVRDGGRFP